MTNRDETIRGLARALIELGSNRTLLKRMKMGAIERVNREYRWDVKGAQMKKLYEEVLKHEI